MQNMAISVPGLPFTIAPVQEGFPPLEDALVWAVIEHANRTIQDDYHRAKAMATAVDVQPPQEPAEHYFVEIPPGSVSHKVLGRVIEAYRLAGWHHTEMSGTRLVIARTKFVPTKTHGAPVVYASTSRYGGTPASVLS